MSDVPTVEIRRRRGWICIVIAIIGVGCAFWAARHAVLLQSIFANDRHDRHLAFEVTWAASFLILAWQVFLAWAEPIHTVPRHRRDYLANLKVTVNVPVYNEDPVALLRGLNSLFSQTRKPNYIQVVDDGSTNFEELEDAKRIFLRTAAEHGIRASWVRQPNAGKRHAQAVTFRNDDADIYVTLDSDTLLDDHAIEEVLKPFANEKVSSVAGLYLGLNADKNLITRIGELVCVSWQLQGRSASSRMGNVLVNSGAFAAYRGWIFRKYIDAYLSETFFGRPVPFSDDAHMTMFSLRHGRTVQQPTACSLTLYPEKVGNYSRQYTRWMRGAFIRMWWRFKYLPLTSYAFWMEALTQLQFIMGCVIFVGVYIYWPTIDHRIWPYTLIIPLALGYVVTARYLLVKRSDVSFGSMLFTYSLAPLMILWCWFVCRPIKIYASLTCLKISWGTRAKGVEVALEQTEREMVSA